MAKAPKIVTMKLADLKVDLFVRKELNQDRVLYLAELIENGVKLDRIQVNPDRRVVDGRHRKDAYELCEWTEIEVEVVDITDETELIAAAYQANSGGALPPTPSDTEHAVMLLLARDTPIKRIGEMLGLPAGMARKYVTSVRSKAARAKLAAAATAVTDQGLTVPAAAEKYGVETGDLKEMLGGRKQKQRKGVQETQRTLTKVYRSLNTKAGHMLRKLIEQYEDGDVTEDSVRAVFKHLESAQKQALKRASDWLKRFEALRDKLLQTS